jgi:hypothetical protein
MFARNAVATDAAASPRPPRRRHRRVAISVENPVVGVSSGEADRLRVENQRLTRELAKSQAVVEIMGKLQGLLETISESTDTPTPPTRR